MDDPFPSPRARKEGKQPDSPSKKKNATDNENDTQAIEGKSPPISPERGAAPPPASASASEPTRRSSSPRASAAEGESLLGSPRAATLVGLAAIVGTAVAAVTSMQGEGRRSSEESDASRLRSKLTILLLPPSVGADAQSRQRQLVSSLSPCVVAMDGCLTGSLAESLPGYESFSMRHSTSTSPLWKPQSLASAAAFLAASLLPLSLLQVVAPAWARRAAQRLIVQPLRDAAAANGANGASARAAAICASPFVGCTLFVSTAAAIGTAHEVADLGGGSSAHRVLLCLPTTSDGKAGPSGATNANANTISNALAAPSHRIWLVDARLRSGEAVDKLVSFLDAEQRCAPPVVATVLLGAMTVPQARKPLGDLGFHRLGGVLIRPALGVRASIAIDDETVAKVRTASAGGAGGGEGWTTLEIVGEAAQRTE